RSSGSQTSAQSVFETIADSAMRLLSGWSVAVLRYEGEMLHLEAARGALPGSEEFIRQYYPMRPDPDFTTGQCVLERAARQITDCWNSPSASLRERSRQRGYQSVLSVPMLHGGEVIGVISLSRKESIAFTELEVDLLKTFADQ